ncbi:MAG: hypothetical protein UU34_C0001G0096 [Candidatus Curtissbacteria bacterium GW2011_GWA1_41_11]|uniref:Uncharacterized protein n=1 Tax=Candidatus Curtissbacteria bacterium GW2011_GWA1_41_11 TaxID=1618409 RepID=A0A0G0UH11_9BACT|nr:MAG: hypothetical protein UU34_C0001G0096 [Candidatus Curtissbacteria bacterium GW2011_GWA1_41_11]
MKSLEKIVSFAKGRAANYIGEPRFLSNFTS